VEAAAVPLEKSRSPSPSSVTRSQKPLALLPSVRLTCAVFMSNFIPASATEVERLTGKTHHWYLKPGSETSDSLVFVRAKIATGHGHPFHRHPEMDEIIYVLAGEMEQWIEREPRILRPGDVAYIPRDVVHGCYNESGADCTFLAVLSPAKIEGPVTIEMAHEEPWSSLK
jgi:quercetin dioxygenase-like cupin family protein